MASDALLRIEGRFLLPDGEVVGGHLLSDEHGKIAHIGAAQVSDHHCDEVLRMAHDWIAVPGFIDVQINGGFGEEVKSNPTAVKTLRSNMPRHGVTSFLPTVTSLPIDAYAGVLDQIRQCATGPGASVLGVHLEGPFLNKNMRGGHPEEYLAIPSAVDEDAFVSDSLVKMVTLAPELDGALPLIDRLVNRGLVVGVGHSTADEVLLDEASKRGLKWGTHVFNAMNPMKGREPGLAGYLLTSQLTTGVIVDGVHVHPRMVRLALALKGPQKLILMTDSSAVTGLSSGTYTFRTRQITTDGVSARLPDGTLVGSVLTLDRAVRNVVSFTDCSLADAVFMASGGPAALLGLHGRKGSLHVGADADVAILDASLTVVATVVKGRIAYRAGVADVE